MSDASTARGGEPTEPITPQPLFPSEGDFSTVVPLSQVGRAPVVAGKTAGDGRPAEADWARRERRGARIARRDAKAVEEEETLVPTRARERREARADSRRGAGQRHWPVTAVAVLLSVLAGVAAGSYLVWSKRPVAVSPTAQEAAAEIPSPAAEAPPAEPVAPPAEEVADAPLPGGEEIAAGPVEEAAPVAPEAPARAADSKDEKSAQPPTRAAKNTTPPAESATRDDRATRARPERAAPAAPDAAPAPRAARNPAPPRRAATNAGPRPTRPATSGRRLPVSAPPPSAKSKTVIQWP